ncbi:butyrophilin-like protein 1 isoform X2 [Scophthalmus maximus]|nr:butyrophilin-like protein 1 isoform X2 [Scophthalmus maximus]
MTNKENLRGTVFDWRKDGLEVFLYVAGSYYGNGREGQDEQYKGRVSHFEEELKDGNSSILIRNTQIADSGNYTCVIPHLLPGRTFYSELVVGAAPKPSIKTHCETKDGVQLQCEVHGASPKPHVQWQDRAGNIVPAEEPQVSERGGSYDIVLQTTVTKTDYYRCVSTQDEINHQTHAETYVPVHKNHGWKFAVGFVVGVVLTLLVVGVVLFVLFKTGRIKRDKGSGQQRKSSSTSVESVPLKPSGDEMVNGSVVHHGGTPDGSGQLGNVPAPSGDEACVIQVVEGTDTGSAVHHSETPNGSGQQRKSSSTSVELVLLKPSGDEMVNGSAVHHGGTPDGFWSVVERFCLTCSQRSYTPVFCNVRRSNVF